MNSTDLENSKAGNILVVCTANVNRSPTGVWCIRILEPQSNVWGRGSNQAACRIHGGTYCTAEDVNDADSIICMEERNKTELIKAYGESISDKISVLGIEDIYKAFDRKLMLEILEKYNQE